MKDAYAFPRVTKLGEHAPGMELRDWLAGMALSGMLAGRNPGSNYTPEEAACYAYQISDAMLAERERNA